MNRRDALGMIGATLAGGVAHGAASRRDRFVAVYRLVSQLRIHAVQARLEE
jgi:hypothetical protein